MDCLELADRLDSELETDRYAAIDASANGLQVERTGEVSHVAVAVDAAVETIERAVERDADLLVTHHGISWGGIERVTGTAYHRIAPLITHDVGLYVSHLPLDGHQTLGNAAGVGDVLELSDRQPFGAYEGEHIGQLGVLSEPISVETLVERLAPELDTGGQSVQTLDFGPEKVSTVAIVTGSGVDWLDEAVAAGADVLITGEGKQHIYHEAKEAGISVVLAGHYATETFGVRSVQELVSEWGLETSFIACPTGL